MGFSSGNTRKEDLGEQEKSPGVKDVACVLPHCPEEDKLEENHQDDDYETYRSFLSLCSSREVKIVPRKSTPVESGGNSELSPLDSPGHCELATGQRGLRNSSTGRGGWMQQRQSCGWGEGSPGGVTVLKSVLRVMGRAWWLGFLCHRRVSEMRNTALHTCVQALSLNTAPALCQCPQLLSGRMAPETPGEGFDQQYRLRICPHLWMWLMM